MSHIIKTLNMVAAETLTLEKAADRLEFEALPVFAAYKGRCTCNDGTYCGTYHYCITDDQCSHFLTPCPKY